MSSTLAAPAGPSARVRLDQPDEEQPVLLDPELAGRRVALLGADHPDLGAVPAVFAHLAQVDRPRPRAARSWFPAPGRRRRSRASSAGCDPACAATRLPPLKTMVESPTNMNAFMLSSGAMSIRSLPGMVPASYQVSDGRSGKVVVCTKVRRVIPLAGVAVVHLAHELLARLGRAGSREQEWDERDKESGRSHAASVDGLNRRKNARTPGPRPGFLMALGGSVTRMPRVERFMIVFSDSGWWSWSVIEPRRGSC